MKNRILALLSATAFNPGSPGWKMTDAGTFEVKDGNPIYIDGSGREATIDVSHITRLNGEAKSHRERAEGLETKLKMFEGIDPELARKALDTVGKLDAKQLIDAGEVDKVRDAVKAEFTGQITALTAREKELQTTIDNMKIGAVFSSSEFLRENLALPLDMVETYFRSNFKIENDKLTAYYKDGNPVMSKQSGSIGNPASAEEALQLLIEAHPQKDMFLKADVRGGTGERNNGGHNPRAARYSMAEVNKLPAAKQHEIMAKARTGEVTLID